MKSNYLSDKRFQHLLKNCLMSTEEYLSTEHDDSLYLYLRHLFVKTKGRSTQYINKIISERRPGLYQYNSKNSDILTNREILAIKGILLKTSGYAYRKGISERRLPRAKGLSETIPLTKDSNRTIISSWKALKSFKIVQRICSDSSVKIL